MRSHWIRHLLMMGAIAAGWSSASFADDPKKPAPPEATSINSLKVPKGFAVELVYTVPREEQGSWVSMTVDPKNRLIVSDQYGKLFRVTPSALGGPASDTKVEAIDVPIGEAHGLLWAFDSLYVVVNRGEKYDSGLYRVTDTNGDDALDKVELLRKINGGGEHGPHAVLLSPDKKSLYIVAGNSTRLPEVDNSLVPRIWGEDNLLPRMVDGSGFMTDERAPGGWVCKTDPDGKVWTLVSMGYRNPYDMAFGRNGELFLYDSDMEWDVNLPWYRPTRVCQVVSGSDFGYRNGAGKWPTYYFDSLPPTAEIGPGSPTGVVFGHGAKFPTKYQEALFICDWSYGKLYALHLKDKGAAETAEVEEFISGTPLPLTDMTVRPSDGALYFAIGGRRTTSGLYRVVYKGIESTASALPATGGDKARATRVMLEAFHGHSDPKAVETAWPYLASPDRFVAFAARVAIEFQDPSTWRQKALDEKDPKAAIPALLALARVGGVDPIHRVPADLKPDAKLQTQLLEALDKINFADLNSTYQMNLVRAYQVVLNRFGKPSPEAASKIIAKLDKSYPSKSRDMNVEIGQILIFLEAPGVAERTVALLKSAPTQEEQIQYASNLRTLATGWTPALSKAYFSWFPIAAGYKGGNSFRGFMKQIKDSAFSHLSESEKTELKPLMEAQAVTAVAAQPPRPFVKEWTLEALEPLMSGGLKGSRDFDRGRTLFAAASCFSCHRFNNEGGGAGPELTGVSGRFNPHDLLESIIKPSKEISDQYGAVAISTTDGQVVTGRIVNLSGDTIMINTTMLDPNLMVRVERKNVDEMKPSKTSIMPEGLLNTLKEDEVLDLMAYLLSRGDRDNPMFRKN